MDAGLVIGGKYHVVRLVAEGGMGAVYDAIHARTGRRVALKLINERGLASGSRARRRFEREARATGGIDSPHVVQVLDAGEDEASGMPFLVMEYLEGEDLRTALARGPLTPAQAVAIAVQVCLGLSRAHAAEIVHRDLKPANLFLVGGLGEGDRPVVKILDFGIAKLLDEAREGELVTRTGDVVGSPRYMSPEQLAAPRDVDHRADLWSLGVVLYEMLSGVAPTADVSGLGANLHAIRHLPAPPLVDRVPGLDARLAALVHRALAVEPAARFASADEMLVALRALEPAASPSSVGSRGGPRHTAILVGTAVAAAAACAVTFALVLRDPARGRASRSPVVAPGAVVTDEVALPPPLPPPSLPPSSVAEETPAPPPSGGPSSAADAAAPRGLPTDAPRPPAVEPRRPRTRPAPPAPLPSPSPSQKTGRERL